MTYLLNVKSKVSVNNYREIIVKHEKLWSISFCEQWNFALKNQFLIWKFGVQACKIHTIADLTMPTRPVFATFFPSNTAIPASYRPNPQRKPKQRIKNNIVQSVSICSRLNEVVRRSLVRVYLSPCFSIDF